MHVVALMVDVIGVILGGSGAAVGSVAKVIAHRPPPYTQGGYPDIPVRGGGWAPF
jgi:hypothetical protein